MSNLEITKRFNCNITIVWPPALINQVFFTFLQGFQLLHFCNFKITQNKTTKKQLFETTSINQQSTFHFSARFRTIAVLEFFKITPSPIDLSYFRGCKVKWIITTFITSNMNPGSLNIPCNRFWVVEQGSLQPYFYLVNIPKTVFMLVFAPGISLYESKFAVFWMFGVNRMNVDQNDANFYYHWKCVAKH